MLDWVGFIRLKFEVNVILSPVNSSLQVSNFMAWSNWSMKLCSKAEFVDTLTLGNKRSSSNGENVCEKLDFL